MPRRSRYRFRPDSLPASRRPVLVTEQSSDPAGLELAADREIVLTLREDLPPDTARRIADLLNDAVENVSLLSA